MEQQEQLYKFVVWGTGETWTDPMPESKAPPSDFKVTIGLPATKQLAKEGDVWVIQPAP